MKSIIANGTVQGKDQRIVGCLPSGSLRPAKERIVTMIIGLLLSLSTLSAYWPVRQHGFINYDDGKYVESNPHVGAGLTREGVAWAFTTTHASNWHPLAWLSHMLDCELHGLNAGGHHLSSLLFHVANTILLFAVLRRITGARWRSAIVAGLFALHPLHVESVAWISERKDVLSTLFFLLTVWAYAKYVSAVSCQWSGVGADTMGSMYSRTRYYWFALVFFALGLMSKPMLVTLPFVLLLLDFWPLGRFQPSTIRRLLWEKLPFFGLGFASCAVTFFIQKSGGAMVPLTAAPVEARIGNALISYVRYLRKMVWPVDLSVFYPFPSAWPTGHVLTAGLCLVLITAGVIVARRARYLAFGWFWYLGTLVPVIGLVQVGSQAMADRYTYIPLIGVFVAIVWGAADLVSATFFRRAALGMAAVVMLAVCGWATHKQVGHWRDSVTLFKHALKVVPASAMAHDSLGRALLARNEFREAKIHLEATLRLKPDNPKALSNLGTILGREGKLDEARRCFQGAIKYDPTNALAHYNLGFALATAGEPAEAIVHYREALSLDPDHVEALNSLAWLKATHRYPKIRDGDEAIRLAKRAVGLTSGRNVGYLDTLAAAYAEAGQFSEAIRTARQALNLAAGTGNKALTAQIQERLNGFSSHHAYRE